VLPVDEIAAQIHAGGLARYHFEAPADLSKRIAQLTDRQRAIIALSAQGRTMPEIASYLCTPHPKIMVELRGILAVLQEA
jgi:DNA-binding NarL/FixJ family response regulator